MDAALQYADAEAVLRKLGPLSEELVLIGGQAVNYWALAYVARSAELQAARPFASKDVDFCGSVQQAEECARRLHGRCVVSTPDALTRRTAVVEYVDELAQVRSVDFLASPFGVDGHEVRSLAVLAESSAAAEVPQRVRVMHPIHVLESRACNVSELPNYRTEKGLKQLRASVICAREFGRDLLEVGRMRDVLRLNERMFSFALRDAGLDVWVQDGISLTDAIVRDPRLPEAFERVRLPQMQNEVEERRRVAAERAVRRGVEGLYVYGGEEFRAGCVVARLTGPDGAVREVDGHQPGNAAVRVGDVVRWRGTQVELVARGQERDRSRGR